MTELSELGLDGRRQGRRSRCSTGSPGLQRWPERADGMSDLTSWCAARENHMGSEQFREMHTA